MLKKSHPGTFQRRKPKMRFPSCLQNQILENPSLILVARPWALQAVFQQPVKDKYWDDLLLWCYHPLLTQAGDVP
jgi:hypothetical protein